MVKYLTYKISEAGISQTINTACNCFIDYTNADILRNESFVKWYSAKYGAYIGVIMPTLTFVSGVKNKNDDKGIVAFL